MSCYYHSDRPGSVVCHKCGKQLCSECGGRFTPVTCVDCLKDYIKEQKFALLKSFGLAIVIFVVLALAGGGFWASLAGACVPYGWHFLNKITPSMFLWMSWFGWVVYFLLKFFLSVFVGLIALFVMTIRFVVKYVELKKLEKEIKD